MEDDEKNEIIKAGYDCFKEAKRLWKEYKLSEALNKISEAWDLFNKANDSLNAKECKEIYWLIKEDIKKQEEEKEKEEEADFNYDEGIKSYKKATDRYSSYSPFGSLDLAEEYFQDAEKLYSEIHNYEKESKCRRMIESVNSTRGSLYYTEGCEYMESGDYEEALKNFEEATKYNRTCYSEQQECRDAIDRRWRGEDNDDEDEYENNY